MSNSNNNSQMSEIEAGVVSNAEQMQFQKKSNAFEGMIKGSDSRILFDMKIQNVNGTLMATLKETGKLIKDGAVKHTIVLNPVDGGGAPSPKTGGKLPHFSGKSADTSLALWKSEYSPTSCFVIFNDVDLEEVQGADALWDAVDDDGATEGAKTFFQQADGDAGRPDTSDEAERSQLEESHTLNG